MKIDPKRDLVIDLRSYEEIKNAIEVDVATNRVTIRVLTYDGERVEGRYYPDGIRVRRR